MKGRGGDPRLNTYHAHALPWIGAGGTLVVAVSQNARNMHVGRVPVPRALPPHRDVRAVPDAGQAASTANANAEQAGPVIPEPRENDRSP